METVPLQCISLSFLLGRFSIHRVSWERCHGWERRHSSVREHLGREPSPRFKSWRWLPKVGCVCWRWVEGRFSGCAGPQLARLCGDHVQKQRVGASGAQPRWVPAPGPGGPRAVSVCASGWAGGPAASGFPPPRRVCASSARRPPSGACAPENARAPVRGVCACVCVSECVTVCVR